MSALAHRFHSRPALVCVLAAHAAAAWAIAQVGGRPPVPVPNPVEVVLLPDVLPQLLAQADESALLESYEAQAVEPVRKPSRPISRQAVPDAAPTTTQPTHAPAHTVYPADPTSPAQPEHATAQAPMQPAPAAAASPAEPPPNDDAEHVREALAPAQRDVRPSDAVLPVRPAPPVPPAVAQAPSAPARAEAADAGAEPPSYSAAYLRNPKPDYPPLSKRLGEQGVVTLRVFVAADGNPQDVQLKASSGFGRLDNAAQDAVRRWRFTPAKRGDEAVAAWVLVPIRFSLKG